MARRTGGRIQLAVSGRAVPGGTLAVASTGSTLTPMRMWSVVKVPTAIALLEASGWDARKGNDPPLIRAAMSSALVGSADCAQRLLVVALQERLGGIKPARTAVEDVLRRGAAAGARVSSRASVASPACRPRLARSGLADPYRAALQLGTAEWSIRDAARFARALGDGTYPAAVQRRVLHLLRQPKTTSDDWFARGLDVTTDPRWGAGLALRRLRPAYKAGWGGSSGETPTFVNEQAIFLRDNQGQPLGVAVSFEPPNRPSRDDPALTAAPEALFAVLRALAASLDLKI